MKVARISTILAVVCVGGLPLGFSGVASGGTPTNPAKLPVGELVTTTHTTSTLVSASTMGTGPATDSGIPGVITPVGTLAAASAPAGANPVSLSIDPEHVGDLMLLGIEDSNTTLPTVSSVFGGGASSWTLIASDPDATYTQDGDEIWEGIVTTAGPATLTVTLNGFSDGDDLVAQEFTAGSSVTWTLDKSGKVTGTDAQEFTYPSLDPAGTAELYFGMGNAINNTQLVGQGTPGVTYISTKLECVSLVAYDTDTSSTLAPAVANTSGGGNGETALAVLINAAVSFRAHPGSGLDVSVGANRATWVVGTNREPGGYGIYFWNGSGWSAVPGAAVRIAVDPAGNPWVTNSVGNIYHWNGRAWAVYPGEAKDVAVGANGSLWAVGTNPGAYGYGIWHWNGSGWRAVPGAAVRIAVDPAGNPWVTNSVGNIYHWNGRAWIAYPGGAKDIAEGANGSLWAVGTNPQQGGDGIWHFDGTAWNPVNVGAVTIAVDPNGNPWLTNSQDQILSS